MQISSVTVNNISEHIPYIELLMDSLMHNRGRYLLDYTAIGIMIEQDIQTHSRV